MTAAAHQRTAPELASLAAEAEDALDPLQRIVDAHHHLYDRPTSRYLLEDMLADVSGSGHDVRSTVFVQARAMLRASGPERMNPIGETEFANGVAAMCASGAYGEARLCAAIVGAADLFLGDAVRPVLEAHIAAAGGSSSKGGRFRGIRHVVAWDRDASLLNPAYRTGEDMLESKQFRTGFRHLADLGLSFDAWLLFPQIPRLTALARAFPETSIVLDHCGGVVRIGAYAQRLDDGFLQWAAALRELASCPNVMVKIGGLGMPLSAFSLKPSTQTPLSQQLSEQWRPWVQTCIDAFGTERCMFESNFPADKVGYSYGVGWNAMKRSVAEASADEKSDLFWRSASRFYRL